jgi:hypothetical protein
MSQSGYTPIQLYRTTTAAAAPTAGNLAAGELAINLTDEKLYFKNAAGTVKTLASSGASTVGGSNTQVQFNSSGTLAGSANFVFDGTNVGIGTTSPPQLLAVGNTTDQFGAGVSGAVTTAYFGSPSSGSGGIKRIAYDRASGNMNFIGGTVASPSTQMTLETSGKVGIGTSSPTTKLQITVAPTGTLDDGMRVTDGTRIIQTNITGSTYSYIGIGASETMLYSSGNPLNIVSDGQPIKFIAGTAERMRILSTGSIAIGGTVANSLLDVNGDITLRNGSGVIIGFAYNNSGWMDFAGSVNVNGAQMSTLGATPIRFLTNSVEKFRILSTGGITSADLVDAVGYKGLPQNSQTASYTLALTDMGKMINTTTGGVVIPANGSVAFPIGSAISIFNNSGSSQTISITTDTLRLAGTATTGSRTLAQYGLATVVKVTSTVWAISGAGVT